MNRRMRIARSIAARVGASLVGFALCLYGIVALLSPLPAGAPLIVVGALMVAAANPVARPLIRRLRRSWRWFDALVRMAGKKGPAPIRDVEAQTSPNETIPKAP
jgi:hypothetical protein